MAPRPRYLVAGARPGDAAGNAVSTQVLCEAVRCYGDVDLLTHRVSPVPFWSVDAILGGAEITLGAQPVLVHAEVTIAARRAASFLSGRQYAFAWAVNSRYAGALCGAGLPYAIWEPTTIRDELRVTSAHESRAAGRGSGLGVTLHTALLPVDEWLESRRYRMASTVCAMSVHTRRQIVEKGRVPADRVSVLPHPPSREFLDIMAREHAGSRRQYPADGVLRLLFVGRVDDPRKNFGLLLDAMDCLEMLGIPHTLDVVGPYTPRWARLLSSHGARLRVTMRGRISTEQLVREYLTHDLLVVPSRQEGFGIVVAEALHAGLPVVSTYCGGPEEVLASSKAGALTLPTPEDFAAGVAHVGGDRARWESASASAVNYARRELAADRFTERVGEIMERFRSSREIITPSRIAAIL